MRTEANEIGTASGPKEKLSIPKLSVVAQKNVSLDLRLLLKEINQCWFSQRAIDELGGDEGWAEKRGALATSLRFDPQAQRVVIWFKP